MSDAGLVEEQALVEPVAVGPGDPAVNGHADTPVDAPAEAPAPIDGGAAAAQPRLPCRPPTRRCCRSSTA